MEPVTAAIGACLLVLIVLAGLGLVYVGRQRVLSQRVGSFTCLMTAGPGEHHRAGSAGVAHYCTDRLLWWRALSLSARPARTWMRADLTVVRQVRLDDWDEAGRPLLAVECEHHGDRFHLTMSESAMAGLVSWLESVPTRPGRGV